MNIGRYTARAALRHVARAVLVVVVFSVSTAFSAGEGDPMPEMKLMDVSTDTEVVVAEALSGSVGAIAYMQTSCAACRKELIALKEISAKYPSLKIIAVSVDSGNPARVKRYKDHFGFEFSFLHDPGFQTPELFGFSFTPALVLVDKTGKIAHLKGGYRPGDEVDLEQKILALSGQ
ncbi:MAG: TlpA disulfide reductase family protein [Deferrisomatales bacterium]|nr:TlpA disulfide reductase family protein [Deferrisomatales bacterium]